jgi:6-pyruvoyltetrahydropterin/6-carboxytetrahydropterin synthase
VNRSGVIELHPSEFSFSAGHFTIFSATEREDLHGHNYSVSVSLQVFLNDNGMAFDYRLYKKKLHALCARLDRRFLLPSQSNYLQIEEKENMYIAHFGEELIPFLKRDVLILPLTNVTIEELSHWFLQELIKDHEEVIRHHVQTISVSVFNGPGQSGTANLSLHKNKS